MVVSKGYPARVYFFEWVIFNCFLFLFQVVISLFLQRSFPGYPEKFKILNPFENFLRDGSADRGVRLFCSAENACKQGQSLIRSVLFSSGKCLAHELHYKISN